ncbi:autotransporter outer membrane beta-barrel domain-containing protein [Acerihabitans sp.]|uniref:autotransporter outer membrane beta-barrel domain-containing protein n=1 Tax=Acerihabitans sp. TaxID=2811394 RepID=UPI002ED9EB87
MKNISKTVVGVITLVGGITQVYATGNSENTAFDKNKTPSSSVSVLKPNSSVRQNTSTSLVKTENNAPSTLKLTVKPGNNPPINLASFTKGKNKNIEKLVIKGSGELIFENSLPKNTKLKEIILEDSVTLRLDKANVNVGQIEVSENAALGGTGFISGKVINKGNLFTGKSNKFAEWKKDAAGNLMVTDKTGHKLTIDEYEAGPDAKVTTCAKFGDDKSKADTLIIKKSISGQSQLVVHNANGKGAKTHKGIPLIQFHGKEIPADSFVYQDNNGLNDYNYQLDKNANNLVLTSKSDREVIKTVAVKEQEDKNNANTSATASVKTQADNTLDDTVKRGQPSNSPEKRIDQNSQKTDSQSQPADTPIKPKRNSLQGSRSSSENNEQKKLRSSSTSGEQGYPLFSIEEESNPTQDSDISAKDDSASKGPIPLPRAHITDDNISNVKKNGPVGSAINPGNSMAGYKLTTVDWLEDSEEGLAAQHRLENKLPARSEINDDKTGLDGFEREDKQKINISEDSNPIDAPALVAATQTKDETPSFEDLASESDYDNLDKNYANIVDMLSDHEQGKQIDELALVGSEENSSAGNQENSQISTGYDKGQGDNRLVVSKNKQTDSSSTSDDYYELQDKKAAFQVKSLNEWPFEDELAKSSSLVPAAGQPGNEPADTPSPVLAAGQPENEPADTPSRLFAAGQPENEPTDPPSRLFAAGQPENEPVGMPSRRFAAGQPENEPAGMPSRLFVAGQENEPTDTPSLIGDAEHENSERDYSDLQRGFLRAGAATAARASTELRPQAGIYAANMATANTMFATRMHDRIGAPAFPSALDPADGHHPSLWLRIAGGVNGARMRDGALSTRTNTQKVQLGGEIFSVSHNGLDGLHVGAMFGAGKSRSHSHAVKGKSAKGGLDGYAAGIYGTWYGNDQNREGLYLDGSLNFNWFGNYVENGSSANKSDAKESYRSRGFVAAMEAGYALKLFSGSSFDTYLQPQMQVTWMGVSAQDHKDRNGGRVSLQGKDNIQTRLGTRLYMRGYASIDEGKQRMFQPYVETNWIHNTKDFGVRMEQDNYSLQGARNIGEIKIGNEGQINEHLAVWGNIGQQVGTKGYHDTLGTLGVKVNF